jgi:hypothetical protein
LKRKSNTNTYFLQTSKKINKQATNKTNEIEKKRVKKKRKKKRSNTNTYILQQVRSKQETK